MADMVPALALPPLAVRSPTGAAAGANFWVALALLGAALAMRAPLFANPVHHIDDQFYLLTGRALLNGELPYLDVWDRKPIGLFLLYAGIALLGGSGIVEYHVVATLFAAATAYVIFAIARRFAAVLPSALAGFAYLASLQLIGGAGGQSPVFYNLLIAGAALATLHVLQGAGTPGGRRLCALTAVTLAGAAITVKHVALFEGAFLGLCLLWARWRETADVRAVLVSALAYLACGLAPTAAAMGVYAQLGALDAFWFANFTSIFLKEPLGQLGAARNLAVILINIGCLGICTLLGMRAVNWNGRTLQRRFLLGWLAAAILGVLAVPNFFIHYALPLLVPMSVAAAALFARPRVGLIWAALPSIWVFAMGGMSMGPRAERAEERYAVLDRIVRENLRGGCLYVHEGPVHLYDSTGGCRLTRFVFPDHLNSRLEANAIGVEPADELGAVLRAQPTVIVTARRLVHPINRETQAQLQGRLDQAYRHVGSVEVPIGRANQQVHVWSVREDARSLPAF